MKEYTVINEEVNYYEKFYSLRSAKKAMIENNATGSITLIRANGDWEFLGEINLKSNNKKFIANSRMKSANY